MEPGPGGRLGADFAAGAGDGKQKQEADDEWGRIAERPILPQFLEAGAEIVAGADGLGLEGAQDVDRLHERIHDQIGQADDGEKDGGVEVGLEGQVEVRGDAEKGAGKERDGTDADEDVDEDRDEADQEESQDPVVLAGPYEGLAEGIPAAAEGRAGARIRGDADALEEGQHPGKRDHEQREDREWDQDESQGLEHGLGDEDIPDTAHGPRGRALPCDAGAQLGAEGGLAGLHHQVEHRHDQGARGQACVGVGSAGHVRPEPEQGEDERGGREVVEQVDRERGFAEEMDRGLDEVEGWVALALALLLGLQRAHGIPMRADSAALPSCHSDGV